MHIVYRVRKLVQPFTERRVECPLPHRAVVTDREHVLGVRDVHDVVDAVGVADEGGRLVLVLLVFVPDTYQAVGVT